MKSNKTGKFTRFRSIKSQEKKTKELSERVLVFGTFDILHPGHNYHFDKARKYGKKLYVVVARDDTVIEVKGRPPMYSEKKRLVMVNNIDVVYKAYLGSLNNKFEMIEQVRPDVICLGYDQMAFTKGLKRELENRGIKTRIVRFKSSHKPNIYKSSKLRKKMEK